METTNNMEKKNWANKIISLKPRREDVYIDIQKHLNCSKYPKEDPSFQTGQAIKDACLWDLVVKPIGRGAADLLQTISNH